MSYLFLASFISGLLLAVRLMFFGAERRRHHTGITPLRRSEPAVVAFLLMFGVAGYLSVRHGSAGRLGGAAIAFVLGVVFAAIALKIAIATARIRPEHDPDDPRFVLQGRVGVVSVAIPTSGQGVIRYEDAGVLVTVPARDIDNAAISAGEEVCIDRMDNGVAYVELWSLVEARL